MNFAENSTAGPEFREAVPGRVFAFPRDHGKHKEFQTEWWYFTGNLKSEKQEWGFQLTFFRRSLVMEPARKISSWGVRDVYPAHFALTDVEKSRFFHADLISREGPDLAGASQGDLSVYVRNWKAWRQGEKILIRAKERDFALELDLVEQKPATLHGDAGYSRKGEGETQASYYYSLTRLKAEGTLTFKGIEHAVTGLAWMDHEFGSGMLQKDQVGWDWFSLQLDDGTDLMVFHMRKKDGTFERAFGTLVEPDGRSSDLADRGIAISAKNTWTSPHTGAVYPSAWTIQIPEDRLNLEVRPLVYDQELITGRSTKIVYWEGTVSVQGSRDGKPVRGKGYVELTGYAHSLAGRL